MRINFRCSGGFGNLRLACDVDTDKLAEASADELSELIESAGFFELTQADFSETPYGAADLVYYYVTITDDDKRKSVGCNDATTPDRLRPLLTHLRDIALANSGFSP